MRVMNGRLHNLVRSPLINNSMDHNHPRHHRHHHRHNQRQQQNNIGGDDMRRRSSDQLPKSIQFDESSTSYRCLCGCFHVRAGAVIIAGIEIFLVLVYFLNALYVLLQQKNSYDKEQGRHWMGEVGYVQIAFIITAVGLAIAFATIILLLVGLSRNKASLLVPHLIIQAISIVLFFCLLVVGAIAVYTDNAFFYRLLNASDFYEYPGQSTVALPAREMVRVYAVLGLYLLSLLLELWFIVVIYNCHTYLAERRLYMSYCLAYSTPLKTLNSARIQCGQQQLYSLSPVRCTTGAVELNK